MRPSLDLPVLGETDGFVLGGDGGGTPAPVDPAILTDAAGSVLTDASLEPLTVGTSD